MQVVILCGGKATRMLPKTEQIPKSLLPVGKGGTPFIERQISEFVRQGLTQILLCAGHLGDQLTQQIGDGQLLGAEVQISLDPPDALLGTAGALRLAYDRGLLAPEFFVTYGDSFLPILLAPVLADFYRTRSSALMTVYCNRDQLDRSNVIFKEGQVVSYDPTRSQAEASEYLYIDYGISILHAQTIVEHVPTQRRQDLGVLFGKLSHAQKLRGYEVFTPFYEIGSPAGLKRFEEYLDATH